MGWFIIAFDCVRIWSIYKHEWLPTILVFVLSMVEPAMDLVSFEYI